MTMTMTHTEKQFLFNCGEEDWTDTWWDIFPEEIITLIYRFVNEDNLNHYISPDYIQPYKRGRSVRRQGFHLETCSILEGKLCSRGWIQYFGSTIYKQFPVPNDLTVITQPAPILSCHQFKMLMADLSNKSPMSRDMSVREADIPFYYKRIQIYKGLRYKLHNITCNQRTSNVPGVSRKFSFVIEYWSENAGRLKFASKEIDGSLTNKNTRTWYKLDYMDFDHTTLVLDHESVEYYNMYKQS